MRQTASRRARASPGYGALTVILFVGDAAAAGAAALLAPELWATFDANFAPTTGVPLWQLATSATWVLALRFFGAGDVASGHFAGRTLSDEEWLDALVAYPVLIERPVVVRGNKAVVARPVARALDIL